MAYTKDTTKVTQASLDEAHVPTGLKNNGAFFEKDKEGRERVAGVDGTTGAGQSASSAEKRKAASNKKDMQIKERSRKSKSKKK